MIGFSASRLKQLSLRAMSFADVARDSLPIGRLLRLSLFQVSVGMATVMLSGTLNRVMIVELSVAAMIVACMAALPVLIAPCRTLPGFRSDTYRSAIGGSAFHISGSDRSGGSAGRRSCLSRCWCCRATWCTRFPSPMRCWPHRPY